MVIINEDNKVSIIDYKNTWARQFSKDTHLGMVTKANTKEELDKYYKEYLNMTIKQKFMANNMALRIFGLTNDQLYELYKKDFVKDDYNSYIHLGYNGFEELDDKQDTLLGINNDNIPNDRDDMSISNNIIIRDIDRDTFVGKIQESMDLENIQEESVILENTAFFTPYEILSFGEDFYSSTPDNTKLTEDISVMEWFGNYVNSFNGYVCENYSAEWMDRMRKLYAHYDRILESGNEQAINNRKQSILNLGWNPEIEFNEHNILIGKQRLMDAARNTQDVYKDYSNINLSEDCVLTEAVDETKYSGVYIVLTKGKTPIVSDSIRIFTNSEYTHAGIAFDEELDEIYSFNMKKDERGKNGFVIENIRNDECIQSVFVLFIEKHKIKEMMSQVKDFELHRTKYDFGILVSKAVNAKDTTHKKYNQVCSSFVDTILHYGNIEFVHTKNNSIASPADIYNSIMKTSNKIYKIFEGSGKAYDSNKTRRIIRSLMAHNKTKTYNEEYIEEKAKPNVCYRVSYEGSSDIFQEVKMAMFNEDRGMKTFDKFYESKCSWMIPSDEKFKTGCKVFLKEKGLKKFKSSVLPTINAYLDKKKVKVDSYSAEKDKVVYEDEYIIATKKSLVKVTEDYNYIEEISSSEQFQVMQKYSAKVQRYADTIGYNRTNIVVRLYFDEADYAYQKFEPVDVKKDKANVLDYIDENTYVISDPHFTKYDDNYDKQMLKLLSSVPEDATMIILGDIGYLKTDNPKAPELIRKYFKQIKCKNMFLVLGNHDVHRLDYYYNLGFKGIYERIIDNKHKWTFSHQPFNGDSSISDYINLHGHIHAGTRYPKGIKNLSTEINCWSGYCTDGKVKTIREWLSFGNTIRNTYLEGELLDDSYDAVCEIQVREPYSTIGMYVEEDVQDYTEKNDVFLNLDKWESGESNLMFITGLSGSGKTTLAKNIAKEYNAEFIETDILNAIKKKENVADFIKNKCHPIFSEYVEYRGGVQNVFKGYDKSCSSNTIDKNLEASVEENGIFFEWIKDYAKTHKNMKFVVEGVWIYMHGDVSTFENYPMIIKSVDYKTTYFRRIKRNIKSNRPVPVKIKKIVIDSYYTWVNKKLMTRHVNKYDKFRDDLNLESTSIGMYVEETDSRYEFIKFPNPRTDKYLENDQECKKYLDTLKKDCIGEIIVDTNSDELAGYVFVNNKKDKGFIFNLIVIPKYRKQGLGRTLINDAVNKLHGVDLTVNKDNTVAVNLYKANGFVIVGDGNSNKEYYMKLKSKLTKDDKVIDEAVSMDDEGNMLIYRATLNTINYGDEIKKSADLCKLYKESSNLDGLKYELCKLWYINAMLEKRIKRNDSKKDEYMANRRICLNVFKTYMKHVLVLDDDFNFVAFYNTTPFSGAIRIDKNTLKYSVKALKELMR